MLQNKPQRASKTIELPVPFSRPYMDPARVKGIAPWPWFALLIFCAPLYFKILGPPLGTEACSFCISRYFANRIHMIMKIYIAGKDKLAESNRGLLAITLCTTKCMSWCTERSLKIYPENTFWNFQTNISTTLVRLLTALSNIISVIGRVWKHTLIIRLGIKPRINIITNDVPMLSC